MYDAARAVHTALGRVDLLINNAGVVSGSMFLDTSDEHIERTMRVNVLASCWTLKAFLPEMMEADAGHIVTIASAAAFVGIPGLADYCASKAAVFGLHESCVAVRALAPNQPCQSACLVAAVLMPTQSACYRCSPDSNISLPS